MELRSNLERQRWGALSGVCVHLGNKCRETAERKTANETMPASKFKQATPPPLYLAKHRENKYLRITLLAAIPMSFDQSLS